MNELSTITQGFIPVNNRNGNLMISGRELHAWLGVGTAYKDWFPRMCEYGFSEGVDFNPLKNEQVRLEGGREVKRTIEDHDLTVNMGKELSMLQRTERGKQARQYFIKIADFWNEPDMVMARALQLAQRKLDDAGTRILALEAKVEQDKPFTDFARSIANSSAAIHMGDFAKLVCNSGIKIGRNRLFRWLRESGYLMRNNKPYQRYVEQGVFEVSEYSIRTITGDMITTTTLVTGKGQLILLDALQQEFGMAA